MRVISMLVASGLLTAAVSAQQIHFTQISTAFNSPVGIDHHEPTNSVVMSVNYSGGFPYNFERVQADGSHVQFSSISGLSDEVKIATIRSGGPGGFQTGDLFTGNGVDGQVVRISADGATVTNPWVDLPGGGNGLMRGGLYHDRTGVFGGDLIVVTTAGQVWRITSAGVPTLLASIGTHLEGVVTVPNDPAKWGPIAGKIIIGAENQGRMYSVDTSGNVEFFTLGVSIEDIDHIPANQNFFGVNFGTSRLLGAPASEFASMAGDILLTQEFPSGGSGLYRLRWDGSALTATQLSVAAGSAAVGQWEHVTFSTAGIVEINSIPVFTTPAPCGAAPLHAMAGKPYSLSISAFDSDAGDTVTLFQSGAPAGATFAPALPTSGNPVTSVLSWTPGAADVGLHIVTFTAIDSHDPPASSQITVCIEVEPGLDVTLEDFHTRLLPLGIRMIQFTTVSETNHAGFLVYRGGTSLATAEFVTASMIPAQGSPTQGAKYELLDRGAFPFASYNYWLVGVDLFGQQQVFGPFAGGVW